MGARRRGMWMVYCNACITGARIAWRQFEEPADKDGQNHHHPPLPSSPPRLLPTRRPFAPRGSAGTGAAAQARRLTARLEDSWRKGRRNGGERRRRLLASRVWAADRGVGGLSEGAGAAAQDIVFTLPRAILNAASLAFFFLPPPVSLPVDPLLFPQLVYVASRYF